MFKRSVCVNAQTNHLQKCANGSFVQMRKRTICANRKRTSLAIAICLLFVCNCAQIEFFKKLKWVEHSSPQNFAFIVPYFFCVPSFFLIFCVVTVASAVCYAEVPDIYYTVCCICVILFPLIFLDSHSPSMHWIAYKTGFKKYLDQNSPSQHLERVIFPSSLPALFWVGRHNAARNRAFFAALAPKAVK